MMFIAKGDALTSPSQYYLNFIVKTIAKTSKSSCSVNLMSIFPSPFPFIYLLQCLEWSENQRFIVHAHAIMAFLGHV